MLLLGATALVTGFIFILWAKIYGLLQPRLGHEASGLLFGVWYWGGLASAYLIRKPGSALAGEFLAALVEFLAGTPFGAVVLLLGFVQGLSAEVVFAWLKFERWGFKPMAAAGALSAVGDFLVAWQIEFSPGRGPVSIGLQGLAMVLSGAFLGGLAVKALLHRLPRT